ncbi:hypothetical protein MYP_588 [Sporocytophaga myxococcoides]|uniref:Lipoprotein n=2 Tax=Sporocytophaga myxococcoides TaxID=153721 RepID=A0A098LAB3_9BACT|nr:hypothetical protein MYP_588 [Sporocytophaga myxococcoides]
MILIDKLNKACLVLFVLSFACSGDPHTKKDEELPDRDTVEMADTSNQIESTDISLQKDTFKVEAGKVFFQKYPSGFWLDSIQKTMPEDEWNEVVADNVYYLDLTRQFLEKNGYKEIGYADSKILEFPLKEKTTEFISTKEYLNEWGFFISNGIDSVSFYNSSDPETDLKGIIK